MFKKTNVELENLTPELAKQFSVMTHLPGERPLKEKRLKFFADHIKAGTFVDPTWSVGIDKSTGIKYRLDGQHTSTLLASLNPQEFPKDHLVTINTYEFDSLAEDGVILFDIFDNPASARSNTDMMRIYRVQFDELNDLDDSFCVKITQGIAAYEAKLKDGKVYPARVAGNYLAHDLYRSFAVWADTLVKHPDIENKWMFGKAGIVAEMLADYKASVEDATQFWMYVVTESHPDKNHVTRDLADDLKKWHIKQERKSQDEYRAKAAKTWARYRKELELDKMGKTQPTLQDIDQSTA
jgi:hypothetical protein